MLILFFWLVYWIVLFFLLLQKVITRIIDVHLNGVLMMSPIRNRIAKIKKKLQKNFYSKHCFLWIAARHLLARLLSTWMQFIFTSFFIHPLNAIFILHKRLSVNYENWDAYYCNFSHIHTQCKFLGTRYNNEKKTYI